MSRKQRPPWTIARARARFSELVRAAAGEPQRVYHRDRLVAVVVDAEAYERFATWERTQERRTLAETFAGLARICAEEEYELALPERIDRPNPFADELAG